MDATTLQAGLRDPVHDAQGAFRAALQALARPGGVQALGSPIDGLALGGAMAHLLLALADETAPVWWQHATPALAQWLRFHTGAPLADNARNAAFAAVTDAPRMPPLDIFAAGSPASPEFSTTLVIEVPSLRDGERVLARGPGIRDSEELRIAGLRPDFWTQWRDNHAAFPQGVDVFFTCGEQAIGLPRTTRVQRQEA